MKKCSIARNSRSGLGFVLCQGLTPLLCYGQTETDTGPANVPYKYTGQEYDGETGLYNYNARLYDPVLGKFITADSIIPNPGDPQSFNRYAYVRNNPINLIDPSGHSWLSDRTGININANRVIHTNLGIDSIQLGYYAGYGGEINIYFTDDDAKVGGGVGVGLGVKGGISAGDVDIFVGHGGAVGVGYDPYGGPYAYAWGDAHYAEAQTVQRLIILIPAIMR